MIKKRQKSLKKPIKVAPTKDNLLHTDRIESTNDNVHKQTLLETSFDVKGIYTSKCSQQSLFLMQSPTPNKGEQCFMCTYITSLLSTGSHSGNYCGGYATAGCILTMLKGTPWQYSWDLHYYQLDYIVQWLTLIKLLWWIISTCQSFLLDYFHSSTSIYCLPIHIIKLSDKVFFDRKVIYTMPTRPHSNP